MKHRIFDAIWVVGVLSLAVFCLCSCNRELDVRQAYRFTLETMPVSKEIVRGQTAEIRCTLISEGDYDGNSYTVRYFQSDGKGTLRMDDGTVFLPNDRYPLKNKVFRLYYTSASSERQTIDIYIEDSFGQVVQKTFDFNNKRNEDDDLRTAPATDDA